MHKEKHPFQEFLSERKEIRNKEYNETKASSDRLNSKAQRWFPFFIVTPITILSAIICRNYGLKVDVTVWIVLSVFSVFYGIMLMREYIDVLEKRIHELEEKQK